MNSSFEFTIFFFHLFSSFFLLRNMRRIFALFVNKIFQVCCCSMGEIFIFVVRMHTHTREYFEANRRGRKKKKKKRFFSSIFPINKNEKEKNFLILLFSNFPFISHNNNRISICLFRHSECVKWV